MTNAMVIVIMEELVTITIVRAIMFYRQNSMGSKKEKKEKKKKTDLTIKK